MKRLLLLAPFALAACAEGNAPYDPVGTPEYQAISHDPFWLVSIGGDRIVLTLGPDGGRADGELDSYQYPRVLPTESNGVRRWESGEGTQVIAIEAGRGPCTTGERTYEDHVTVYLSGRRMVGCGGRQVRGEPSQ